MITSCMNPSSCKGVCLSNVHINSKHTYNPIWWNHKSPSPSPYTHWGWSSPPFANDFHPKMEVILNQEAFVFALVLSPHPFLVPFRYGIWIFMKLFCPKWFCEWLRPLFWGMWAHCSRSCSTLHIALWEKWVFCN